MEGKGRGVGCVHALTTDERDASSVTTRTIRRAVHTPLRLKNSNRMCVLGLPVRNLRHEQWPFRLLHERYASPLPFCAVLQQADEDRVRCASGHVSKVLRFESSALP